MLTYKAFAKINWALSVLNKRNDGYHDIISLMHAIDLYDILIFEPSSGIEIQTELPIKRENNLIYKAIIALQQYTGIKKGIKVTLQKQIPIGAGLGGGSSDAATTLKALNELWGLNLGVNTLQKIGVSIGSDVPFFFNLPLCIVEGRGDIIKPLKIEKSYTLVIVKPKFSISTKWAYEFLNLETELTTEYKKINNNIWQLYLLLCEGAYSNFHSWNDLEKSVSGKYPEIEKIKKKLLEAGALMSLLSGSGSTVFGVFNNEVDANETLKIFEGYWCKVVQTLTSY
ncbi:4-(cytidine 5'-diphospho)-2-C-methyl-D-erythritol kinase [Thermodesulfovibrio thiophilus]|uniref:4-(cytidine 5'-diphospho)-2-C-methyl-D-erythritol kinase n=1 Tax=Thermodesulfovibrio thiophilus TaxID=340095 RepID=UPI001859C571|nr:4-(cytidine 5'-diphospho)-2-C-methyl-D-erythritol kinase [Thermodesulfovibrio thiophilus]HHW20420.1 4-(cytidine 5'-diphospho)-2-C-methyl-D-erythritol kinase [Thermodesulfovibrio thiophilus]